MDEMKDAHELKREAVGIKGGLQSSFSPLAIKQRRLRKGSCVSTTYSPIPHAMIENQIISMFHQHCTLPWSELQSTCLACRLEDLFPLIELQNVKLDNTIPWCCGRYEHPWINKVASRFLVAKLILDIAKVWVIYYLPYCLLWKAVSSAHEQ